jgi:signal peptidase II
MKKKLEWKWIVFPLIALLAAALDLITKQIVVSTLPPHQPVEFIGVFWRWTFIRNTGVVFGILSGLDASWKPAMLVATNLVVMAVVVLFYKNLSRYIRDGKPEIWGRTALMMIMGGAVGNIIDRIINGSVIDFIDWGINHQARFFIFNVGDSFLVVGSILLGILFLFFEKKEPKPDTDKVESKK